MRSIRSPLRHCLLYSTNRPMATTCTDAVAVHHFFHKWEIHKSQIFFNSTHCYGLINLKPIVPGHVLVISKRVVPRLADLTSEEVADLFDSVHKIGSIVEKLYGASALNIAVQDGHSAGQSVPHVHVHLLPRKANDFTRNDDVYEELERHRAEEAVLLATASVTPTNRPAVMDTVTSEISSSSTMPPSPPLADGTETCLQSETANTCDSGDSSTSISTVTDSSGGSDGSSGSVTQEKVDFQRERQSRTAADMAEESRVLRAVLAEHGVLGVAL